MCTFLMRICPLAAWTLTLRGIVCPKSALQWPFPVYYSSALWPVRAVKRYTGPFDLEKVFKLDPHHGEHGGHPRGIVKLAVRLTSREYDPATPLSGDKAVADFHRGQVGLVFSRYVSIPIRRWSIATD